MNKVRLDQALLARGLTSTRSQAENYIKLGYVRVDGRVMEKPGKLVDASSEIELVLAERYVSRAALKLDSVAQKLALNFADKIVLDIGSSTGGFTDYALQHGASRVIAVDVGSNQLHPSLRGDKRIELHEKTDIRNIRKLSQAPDIVLIDVSFISIRLVLPAAVRLSKSGTQIAAMVKPQFEAGEKDVHRGIIKNETIRRRILREFENWTRGNFLIEAKADSDVTGSKGNRERFYLLRAHA